MAALPENLPLACLHEHADGWVKLDTFMELALGSPLPEVKDFALRLGREGARLQFSQDAWSGDLARCLSAFALTSGVMQTKEAVERIFYEHAMQASEAGAVYFESRFAPSLHTRLGMAQQEAVEAALAGLARGERDFGVQTALVVCALRGQGDGMEAARLAARCAPMGVRGFDVAGGPEKGHPVSMYLEALKWADKAGLGVCPHVGEADGPLAVQDALDALRGFGRVRFGHGLQATPRQIDEMARRGICVEANVTSNVATGLAGGYKEHPVGSWIEAGVPVALSTDDGGETIFSVGMRQEWEMVSAAQGWGMEQWEHCIRSALDCGFAEPSKLEKARAMAQAALSKAPAAPKL